MTKKSKILFHLGHSAGFYSEYNNMVFAILYCLENNIEFLLYSQDANFRTKKGWTDYFNPFCKEIVFRPIHYFNGRNDDPKLGIKSVVYGFIFRNLFKNIYLTQDLWLKFRTIDKTFKSVRIDNEKVTDFKSACRKIIDKTYNFNAETKSEIRYLIDSIDLPDRYVGVHIRGGDKITECELINTNQYMKKITEKTNCKHIFVSTDDYSLFEQLKRNYPEFTFYTISENYSKGYLQSDFVMSSPLDKRKQMINMFASMELLLKSEHTFCTYSSNIGMFIGLVKEKNVHPVDFENWVIW